MNLGEFSKEFVESIRSDSFAYKDTPSNVFLDEMIRRLEEITVLFNSTKLQFFKSTKQNGTLKFDAFSIDEVDKTLILIANEFVDDINPKGVFNEQNIRSTAKHMSTFLKEVLNGSISQYIDPSMTELLNFCNDLKRRLELDYVKTQNDDSLEKIKFVILTNKKLTNRQIKIKETELGEREIEIDVWDIERIFDLISSGKDREPLIVDFSNYGNSEGIPFIKVDFENNPYYDAFLCIIPGKTLSDIYYNHGSRLLEGNVRTFLSARGKINKSIRETIKSEPNKFFAYNNGISCTAKVVEFSKDKSFITKIEDLQIINGGQTTASLTSAEKKDKAKLDLIYVPMKLTLIKGDKVLEEGTNPYEEMVQKIAQYANSQNKIKDSDFFSNHPFHREMEKLSKIVIVAPKAGEFHNTFYFYERSRGSYEQLQFKFTNQSQRDGFQKKFPKTQVIKKEELAKYLMAGLYLQPEFVSKGSEKNMISFSEKIEEFWKNPANVNELYFKRAVAYSILYKKVDDIVAHASWYFVGGPKLNVVPYTISKFIHSIPTGFSLDLNKIWENQALSSELIEELNKLAKETLAFIIDSKGILVTEYAKKTDTWNKYKDVKFQLSKNIADDLISDTLFNQNTKSQAKAFNAVKEVEFEIEVMNLAKKDNGQYWQNLVKEGKKRKIISLKEEDIILKYVSELGSSNPKKYPSTAQMKVAWEYRKRLEENGALV
jgi:hypothetical protein